MAQSLVVIILETVVISIISIVALIGNLSLFIIVYKNKNLRTISNMYNLNLATADILVSLLSMPVTAITIIKQRWVFGQATCTVLGFLTMLSFIASVMNLGMIAINRYFYIVKWGIYRDIFTTRKALLYGVAVWIAAFALALTPLFGWAEYQFIPGKSYCFVYWPSNVYYSYFMIFACFFGPLLVAAFSYYSILSFARSKKKKVANCRNNLPLPTPNTARVSSNERQNSEEKDNIIGLEHEGRETNMQNNNPSGIIKLRNNKTVKTKPRRHQKTTGETRITNTLLLVLLMFTVCWAPFTVTMFFDLYHPTSLPRAFDIISLFLGYTNSLCNPIIYGIRNSAFKEGFFELYTTFIPWRFRPSKVINIINHQNPQK